MGNLMSSPNSTIRNRDADAEAPPVALPGRPELRSLTSLRFFAAMLVVFFHCGVQFRFPAWTGDFFTNGYEAVSFFFVLSGFILTYVYAADPETEVPRRRFWVARIARI